MTARVTHRSRRELPPLSIAVLPADEAYDFEFVASRLHDRHLLQGSVAVRVFRTPLLAVPVGGRRRGGYVGAGPVSVALAIRDALRDLPGFPDLRVRLAPSPTYWVVEWGDRASDWPLGSAERIRFYGYCDHLTAETHSRSKPLPPPPQPPPAATISLSTGSCPTPEPNRWRGAVDED